MATNLYDHDYFMNICKRDGWSEDGDTGTVFDKSGSVSVSNQSTLVIRYRIVSAPGVSGFIGLQLNGNASAIYKTEDMAPGAVSVLTAGMNYIRLHNTTVNATTVNGVVRVWPSLIGVGVEQQVYHDPVNTNRLVSGFASSAVVPVTSFRVYTDHNATGEIEYGRVSIGYRI